MARGRLFRQWQVVPHARVQTVDTKRGAARGSVRARLRRGEHRVGQGRGPTSRLDPARVADALVEELARRAGIDEGTSSEAVRSSPPDRPAACIRSRSSSSSRRKRIGQSVLPIAVVALTWRGGLAIPVLLAAALAGLALLVAEWRRFTSRIDSGRSPS